MPTNKIKPHIKKEASLTFKRRSTISTTCSHEESCKTIDKRIRLGGKNSLTTIYTRQYMLPVDGKNGLVHCDYCNLTSECYFTGLEPGIEPPGVK